VSAHVRPGEPADDADDEERSSADRWSWVFWLLLTTAATPLGLSVAAVHQIVGTADVVEEAGDLTREPAVFADHWAAVLSYDPLSWPTTISAFAVLVLAGLVLGTRPGWLVVARRRLAVGLLAGACALWAFGTTTISAWVEFQGPTARQRAEEMQGYQRVFLLQWVSAGGLGLLATLLALTALVLCLASRRTGRSATMAR
jgi:hypothetical protein